MENSVFGNAQKYLKLATIRYDLLFATMVVFIVLIILLPIPPVIIDSLLSLSISISIVILVAVIFSEKPLDFSSFPTILLLSTLLRLAVNVASTRAILVNGHLGTKAAGHIIETFGLFVMKGSLIVGVIIFSILTIINFIVITKGAGRIAEVSARFSLDAMPGKQMSIDADLSAGIIDEQTAKNRRSELEEESTFFGAMDGASKFVRGDAIAGILITFVNFLGGSIIGVVEKQMLFSKALKTYTILTIGDGLVSQIPSLIISVAAGLLVSKARMEGSTEKAILRQISKDPKSLGLTGTFLLMIAMIPGMPALPFLLISSLMLFSAYTKHKSGQDKEKAQNTTEEIGKQNELSEQIKIDPIKLELGSQILSLASKEGNMKTQINLLKKEFIDDLGFVIPQTRIQDNFLIDGQDYIIKIKGIQCAKGQLYCNMLLVMSPDDRPIEMQGKHVLEPVFGLPAIWINEFEKRKATSLGYTIIDPLTILIAHLREAIKDNIEDLVSYSSVQNMLANVGEEYQKMVGDIIPSQVTLNVLQRVLQLLLSELISIRDLPYIIELIAEANKTNQSLMYIVEYVRMGLSKQISDSYASDQKVIKAIVLSQKWESDLGKSITNDGSLALSPNELRQFMSELKVTLEKYKSDDRQVFMCKPPLRPHIRDVIKRLGTSMPTLSQNEIHPKYSLEVVAYV